MEANHRMPPDRTTTAGPQSPEAVLERFAAHFATLDAEAQALLFHEQAAFFGSSHSGLLRGPSGARQYFGTAWAQAAPGIMTCEIGSLQRPSADVALVAAVCRLVRPTKTTTLRLSGALTRDGTGWRFAELHVSAEPH